MLLSYYAQRKLIIKIIKTEHINTFNLPISGYLVF